MVRCNTLSRSGLRAAVGHIAGQDRGNETVCFEGIALKPEPSIGVDRGGKVTLWGRGCPPALRGRAVNVRTATGLMLGDRIGDAQIRKRRGHIEGYGLVWGASKSVSLLLAVLDDRRRQELLRRFESCVQRAIDDAEEWLWVRRGAGGKEVQRVAGGLCAYAIHTVSGRGDPHLHVHVLLRAVGQTEDGWRTIDSESVLEPFKKVLDARLARYLREALEEMGIAVRERVVGSVPTLEVPALEPLTTAFSARAREVLAAEGEACGWRNHLRAWYESRRGLNAEVLEHAMDSEVLGGTETGRAIIAAWRDRLGCERADCFPGLFIVSTQHAYTQHAYEQVTLEDALHVAGDIVRLSDLIAFQAYRHNDYLSASALDEVAEAIRAQMLNDITGWQETLLGYFAGTVRDRRVLYRVAGKGGMLIQAEGMRQTRVIEGMWRKMLRDEQSVRVAVAGGDGLSDEQQAALAMIAAGRRVVVISGTAGAGKSQVLERISSEKYILTRNAVLGHDLAQRVGGRWATLARADQLLREVEERDARGETSVIVIDEGSLVDRTDWLHVLQRVKRLRHTQLILLGDLKQIESIDRTHIWRLLVDRARRAGTYAELRVSRRTQEWQEEHRALRHLRRDVDAIRRFLRMVHRRGGLQIDADPRRRAAEIVAEGLQEGKRAVVVTATNEDAAYVSAMVQRLRGITPVAQLMGGQRCGVGDLVRLRRNQYKWGVFNGMQGVVVGVAPEGISVRMGDERVVFLPSSYCQEWVQLGYAVTADSSQGLTVDQALVLVDGMDFRRTYVAATRSRRPPIYVASSAQAMAIALATRDELAPPRAAADILLPREERKERGISM